MYLAFLGFREKPFNLTPDPKFLYLNASYREALAALHYGIAERKGFVSLIGEAGTGKTTLLRRLLSELPRETRSVLVLNPAVGFEELLRFILADLGRPQPVAATKLQMLETLNVELLDTLARGGNVVVMIDEAQDLTVPVLEELRLLSNLETAKEKILQFVLAGQPELDATLARAEIRQLRQRIAVRPRLRPLLRRELEAYVAARVAAAGGDARGLFTRPALFRLWRFSGGVPRLVNVACDNALVTAYAVGVRRVGWKVMGEALRDLREERRRWWMPTIQRIGPSVFLTAAIIGGVAGLGAAFLAGRASEGSRVVEPPLERAVVHPSAVASPASPSHDDMAAAVEGAASPRAEEAGLEAPAPAAAATPAPASASVAKDGDARTAVIVAEPETVEVAPSPGETPSRAEVAGDAALAEPSTARVPPAPRHAPHHADVLAGVPPAAAPAPILDADEGQAADAPVEEKPSGREEMRVAIGPGDTLGHIAFRHYGYYSSQLIEEIRRANPGIRNDRMLMVGQTIVLPEGHHFRRDEDVGSLNVPTESVP